MLHAELRWTNGGEGGGKNHKCGAARDQKISKGGRGKWKVFFGGQGILIFTTQSERKENVLDKRGEKATTTSRWLENGLTGYEKGI